MSAFHGPAGKGAMSRLREVKRLEAVERNAASPPERRSIKRRLSRAMARPGAGNG